ncbi:diguanylate cyclase [Mycoplasmatota bacterium WC44]
MDKEKRIIFSYLGYFILILLLIFISFFSFMFIIEKRVIDVKNDKLRTQEINIVNLEQGLLGNEVDGVLSDLLYLADNFVLNDNSQYDMVAEEWKMFSERRKIYDQIRFIDQRGDEIIRINYLLDKSEIVNDDNLQNKNDRYYFCESIEINSDQIYISQLDLNVENFVIQEPKEPVMRFSKPVYDENNDILGVIVLNYKASFLLEDFKDISRSSNGEIYLLNSSGYWLSSNDTTHEWGFMYDELQDVKFQTTFGYEWDKMTESEGSFLTDNGLFTYGDVVVSANLDVNGDLYKGNNIVLGDGNWKVVSFISTNGPMKDVVNTDNLFIAIKVLKSNSTNFSLIILGSVIVALLFIRNKRSSLRIKYFSEYDSLTNVLNRRAGLHSLMNCIPYNNNRVDKVCVCFLDVNGLKEVNDIIGHDAGDELLVTVTKVLKESICPEDYIVRLGGDEFLVIFVDKELEDSEVIWENIYSKFDFINENEDRHYMISVSHGIAEYNKTYKDFVDQFIKSADEKMYLEKKEMKKDLQILKFRGDKKS